MSEPVPGLRPTDQIRFDIATLTTATRLARFPALERLALDVPALLAEVDRLRAELAVAEEINAQQVRDLRSADNEVEWLRGGGSDE